MTHSITDWLPVTPRDAALRGWEELDVILFSGDAYVDHPAFGHAVIGRIIAQEQLRVAIVPQPNWQDDLRDFQKFGRPRLFFGVTGGCMDPMVNHYTANKRRRSTDAYTPGGAIGFRPDRATVVYSQILKRLYPDVPVMIGGIEASLRRVTHYDYWDDRLMPSILIESGADLLIYGMGEQPLRKALRLLKRGVPFESLRTLEQSAFVQSVEEALPKNKSWKTVALAAHDRCLIDKRAFAANFKVVEQESNRTHAQRITQEVGEQRVVINPPMPTMSEAEIDASFDLPYTRLPHPRYRKRGEIPAYEMIKFSVNMHRGCFGGCSFCTISAHQGKFVASRSPRSILDEVDAITRMPGFNGVISDLGGPSANMYKMKGKVQAICDRCVSPSCISPMVCHNLDTSHKPLLEIYREAAAHPEVRHAFVGSGIRYDLLVRESGDAEEMAAQDDYLEALVTQHVSGRLKVAPEHTSDEVLKLMRKPSFKQFHRFKEKYDRVCAKHQLKQQLIPYFISSHPGCDLADMAHLAAETKELGFQLEQVQDFTPTPMTVATVIYYSGFHPYSLKPLTTVRSQQEKLDQRRFFFWYKPENQHWIRETLRRMGREALATRLLQPSHPRREPARAERQRTRSAANRQPKRPHGPASR